MHAHSHTGETPFTRHLCEVWLIMQCICHHISTYHERTSWYAQKNNPSCLKKNQHVSMIQELPQYHQRVRPSNTQNNVVHVRWPKPCCEYVGLSPNQFTRIHGLWRYFRLVSSVSTQLEIQLCRPDNNWITWQLTIESLKIFDLLSDSIYFKNCTRGHWLPQKVTVVSTYPENMVKSVGPISLAL